MEISIYPRTQFIERKVKLSKCALNYKLVGRGRRKALVLIHGNMLSSDIWRIVLDYVDEDYDVIAPDLRAFGKSDRCPVDATRGVSDYSDDLVELLSMLKYEEYYVLGHSMGGNVALQMFITKPRMFKSIILLAPGSPYGWGGTKDIYGTPCYDDYAGSGGGLIKLYNPEFLRLLKEKYRGIDHPASPRLLARNLGSGGIQLPEEVEEFFLEMIFQAEVGDDYYPGDYVKSPNWPYFAPGTRGVLNAISPKYLNQSSIVNISEKVPVLWIHGENDIMVSNNSAMDPAVLGMVGIIPNYPGPDIYPPQPMLDQIKYVLERYEEKGGTVKVKIIPGGSHIPYLEKPKEVFEEVNDFLKP
ncbi:MAG: hypothetical protein B7O98_06145 [Zestosphaera tikiterensis]|uniref:AB hydrolase-1 domain-containing protein n=1 Tax=Zestosphaera tikiterensis TaxID=1973259 RepID=A0A2R7Y3W2_9CREN|nr:MAG: hypothetical protein B7O98_06145 [Zestosphaera tikiterensis]